MMLNFRSYIFALTAVVCAPHATAGVFQMEGDFYGANFFPQDETAPFPVLSGSWSATIDDTSLSENAEFLLVRPDELVFDQGQTFGAVTWNTSNTFVEVRFNDGVPTGTVVIQGDSSGGFDRNFSASGTDFEIRYDNNLLSLADEEPLSLLKYSISGQGDFSAGPGFNLEQTIFSGSASIVEVQNVVAGGSGPVEFLGGPEAESGTGLAIDFGTESDLIVTVDPTPSFAEAELILVNLFAQKFVAWDISVEGEITDDSTIYIPFDATGIGIPSVAFVVYHFDESLGEWELLDATFDPDTGLITATTDNFSPVFAAVVEDTAAAQELLRQLNSVAVPLPSTMLLALAGLLLMRKFRARLA